MVGVADNLRDPLITNKMFSLKLSGVVREYPTLSSDFPAMLLLTVIIGERKNRDNIY